MGSLGGALSTLFSPLLHLIWSIITKFTFSHVLGLAIKTAIFRKTTKVDKQPSKTCPTELKLGPRV
jgi:hypothetical protein